MKPIKYYRNHSGVVCYKYNINRIIGRNAGDPTNPKDWEPIDHIGSDQEAKECLANGFRLLGLEGGEYDQLISNLNNQFN